MVSSTARDRPGLAHSYIPSTVRISIPLFADKTYAKVHIDSELTVPCYFVLRCIVSTLNCLSLLNVIWHINFAISWYEVKWYSIIKQLNIVSNVIYYQPYSVKLKF